MSFGALKLCFLLPRCDHGDPRSRVYSRFSLLPWMSHPFALLEISDLGSRYARELRPGVKSLAHLSVVVCCTSCHDVQNAAAFAAAHDTQKKFAFGVRCSFIQSAFFGCRLPRLPLWAANTARSPRPLSRPPLVPTHVFSHVVWWVFMVICGYGSVLAVCCSFGGLRTHGRHPCGCLLFPPVAPGGGFPLTRFRTAARRRKAPPLPPPWGGDAKRFIGGFSACCSVFASPVFLSVFCPLPLRFRRCWAVAVSVMVLLATLSILGGTIYRFLCPGCIRERHTPLIGCIGTSPRRGDDLSYFTIGGRFIMIAFLQCIFYLGCSPKGG